MNQEAAPSRAVQARRLVDRRHYGVLSTSYFKAPGHPYGSTAPYAVDADGRPIFLFANLATHYRNLAAEDRASLIVMDEAMETDPMDAARVTLLGRVRELTVEEWPNVQELYFARFPEAREFLEIGFSFFRMEIESIHWIGGFGGAGWPQVSEYRAV